MSKDIRDGICQLDGVLALLKMMDLALESAYVNKDHPHYQLGLFEVSQVVEIVKVQTTIAMGIFNGVADKEDEVRDGQD